MRDPARFIDSGSRLPGCDYVFVAEISAKLGKESKVRGILIARDIHTVKVVSL